MDDPYGRTGGNMYGPPLEQETENFGDYEEPRNGPAGGFEVGNLKGNNGNWAVNRMPERQTNLGRVPPSFKQSNFDRGYDPPARTERPTWPGQPRSSDPRLEDVERSPWQRQRPSSKYGSILDAPEVDSPREPWQRTQTKYGNQGIYAPEGDMDSSLSNRCFQMVQTTQPRCQDQTVTGQFWFYNFCADECMLFATDQCDRNLNKFSRWEDCERCRQPEMAALLQEHSNSPECQNLREIWQTEERAREEKRASNRRRNYGGYRQRARN